MAEDSQTSSTSSMTPASRQAEDLGAALVAARAGDEAGFVRLYRDLHPRILRYAATLVGAEAEDVAAETWLQVSRDLPRFVGDHDAFRGWVATIARNRALDLLRTRTRRPVVLDDLVDLHEQAAPDDTATAALDRLRTRQAIALIATLPRDQAEAVMLRSIVGLDVARAAEVLGKRPTAVRVATHRGLKRLAARLATDPAPGSGDLA